MPDDLVEMARLAQHDERMATGALYGDLADRIEELEAKLEAIEALMVRRIQSVSHNSTSYNQDTLSDSRKRKNSVREYALSLALGEIRQVIKGQTGGIDDRIPN